MRFIISLILLALITPLLAAESPYWLEAMQKVHAGHGGSELYVAQYGDSITHSMAFWSVFDWSDPDKYIPEDGLPIKPANARWRDTIKGTRAKGAKYANGSGWRINDLLNAMPADLEASKPVMAIIMIGTNDIRQGTVPDGYKTGLEKAVQMCIDANCIPIMSTIPPMKNRVEAAEAVNAIVTEIAQAKKVPMIDYYGAIMERQPHRWLGTLISDDGVHPTAGMNQIFKEHNLKRSGYALRNYVSFLAMREVYFQVIVGTSSTSTDAAPQEDDTPAVSAAGIIKEDWDWAAAMKEVTAKYTGKPGKVVPMGDSITYANQASRFARYGKQRNGAENAICSWMNAGKNDTSNGWFLAADDQANGRSWTAASGVTSGQYIKGGKAGLPPLADIIKEHNPQIALILLGTNDLKNVSPGQYLNNMETIYKACLDNGTIPVVQTVPPSTWDTKGNLPKFNEGLIKLARKHKLPVIDVYGEFLARQPGEAWLGTLISNDGAHPTHETAAGPATTENLATCGHLLRCWLSVHKVIEIKKKVLD